VSGLRVRLRHGRRRAFVRLGWLPVSPCGAGRLLPLLSVQFPHHGGELSLRRPTGVRALGRTDVARREHEAVAGRAHPPPPPAT